MATWAALATPISIVNNARQNDPTFIPNAIGHSKQTYISLAAWKKSACHGRKLAHFDGFNVVFQLTSDNAAR
nr:hypothetical protein [Roseovarius sp. W115]